MAPPGFLIGRSVHSASEAAELAAGDIDYLIAGAVWETSSKPNGPPALGMDGLAAIARASAIPVLAVGGVSVERIQLLRAAGAAGAAAIGMFMAPPRSSSWGCRAIQLDALVAEARARFGRVELT